MSHREPWPRPRLDRRASARSIHSFIERNWQAQRSPNSAGCDQVVADLADRFPGRIIRAEGGQECLTWLMPKRWEVRQAQLRGPKGETIVDVANCPLAVWWHSVPVRARLSLAELQSHLCSDESRPELTPFHYRNGYQYDAADWGFCLPHSCRANLEEGSYEVLIDSSLEATGAVTVLDYHLPGDSPETVFFAAHSCHSGQVTDGLAGLAAIAEVFGELAKLKRRRYSYRLIAGPEYFGAAAFLAHTPDEDIRRLLGGYYVDLLGNGRPLTMQRSFQGNTVLDRVALNVLKARDPEVKAHGYRKVVGNDEMFYEGTGFWIPTPGIACPTHGAYHTDADDLERLDMDGVLDGAQALLDMVTVLESDCVPSPQFRGPLQLSRYGLYIDPKVDRKGYESLESIMIMMNGERSCLDIASELDIDVFFVLGLARELEDRGLAELWTCHGPSPSSQSNVPCRGSHPPRMGARKRKSESLRSERPGEGP